VKAYGTVFSGPFGQQVFQDLSRSCFMHKTTFAPGDPHQTAFNEGMRATVLLIQRMVMLSSDPSFTLENISNEFTTTEGE